MDMVEAAQPQGVFEHVMFFGAIICIAGAMYARHLRLKGEEAAAPFLNKERQKVEIIDVVELSHDTKRLRLSLGSKEKVLGLPVGKHIVIYAPNPAICVSSGQWNEKPDPDKGVQEITRKYTPVTGNESAGYVDLVVKVYRPGTVRMPDGTSTAWKDGGKASFYLGDKMPGDFVEIMGPVGANEYLGHGKFKLPGRTVTVTDVGMLAGGTGLTPMLQIVKAALRDPNDSCNFTLIYANKTVDDILCREMLEDAVKNSGGRFKLQYTVDFPPTNWSHDVGFITAEMIKRHLPPPGENTLVLMCGPPPMIQFACKQNLATLGYEAQAMVMF